MDEAALSVSVRELIAGAPIGDSMSVTLLGQGFASWAHKVTSSEGEFVVLSQKSDGIEPANYAYHFAILKTLEAIDYHFAPRAVYVNPQQTAIVLTLVPGESITWINSASAITQEQGKQVVETLVTALLDLRMASFARCAEVYRHQSGKELETTTIQKNVTHYMTDWLRLAQAGRADPEITEWITPKVTACERFVRDLKPREAKILIHGDTSEPNILLTRELRLHLIDWDGSGFDQFPEGWDDFGMAYLFNHVPLFGTYRSLVTNLVTERCGITTAEFDDVVLRQRELIQLGDVMWAYMMNARVAAGEIGGEAASFLAIAQQRMDDYQQTFADTSFLR
jgi:aminoglycoside phosphotransferase (APT) family kinase protein